VTRKIPPAVLSEPASSTRSPRVTLFAYFAVLSLGVATLGLEVWAIPRGFDMTDEGFHYQYFSHPEHYTNTVSSDYLYSGCLFIASGHSIIGMRALRLTLYLLAAWVFSQSMGAFICKEWKVPNTGLHTWATCSLVFMASMPMAWLERSLAYNSWTTLSVLFAITCFLKGLFGPSKGRYLVGTGVFLGICFFVKFTAGISILLLMLACCFLASPSTKEAMKWMALLIAGFFLWASLHFVFFINPIDWFNRFQRGLSYWASSKDASHSLDLLWQYAAEIWVLCVFAIKDLLLFGWIALLPVFTQKRQWLAASVVFLATGLVWKLVSMGFWQGGNNLRMLVGGIPHGYMLILLIGFTFAGSLAYRAKSKFSFKQISIGKLLSLARQHSFFRKWGILFALTLLPLAAAIGTNNPLSINMCFLMPCWSFVAYTTIASSARAIHLPTLAPVALLSLAALHFAQTLSGRLGEPYRIPTSLTLQTHPIRVGPGNSLILVDEATAIFHNKLEALFATNRFEPSEDIISLFSIGSGYTFWLGGVSPINPWTSDVDFLEEVASQMNQERKKKCYFILQKNDLAIASKIRSLGFRFPDGYSKLGELRSPYWKPRPLQFWGPYQKTIEDQSNQK